MNNNRTGGLKHLLLAHCEKVIVLGVLGVAGYLLYASTGIERYSKKTADLSTEATQTSSRWDQFSWSEAPEENVKKSFDPSNSSSSEVDRTAYVPAKPRDWSRPVVPPTIDRVDPPLLAAQDVEGVGVTGLMAFINEDIIRQRQLEEQRREAEEARRRREEQENATDEPGSRRPGNQPEEESQGLRPAGSLRGDSSISMDGDELIRTVSCAVVVAKAPLLDQYKIYNEQLENARGYNPANDYPMYRGYFVERAEVREGKTGQWSRVPVTDGQGRTIGPAFNENSLERLTQEWVAGAEEQMDPAYEDPALTMPLPPLVGESWPSGVVHRDVPLAIETEAALEALEGEPLEEEQPDGVDELGFGGNTSLNPRTSRLGGSRSMPREGGRSMRGGSSMRGGRSMRGEEMGPRSMSRSPGQPGTGDEPTTPSLMVRFFDFTAQPGRQYRYRVRLVLADVNNPQLVSRSYLDAEAAARVSDKKYRSYRFTEWSEPSRLISIPMAGDVHITEAKLPAKNQANSEGRVTFLVQAYDVDEDGRATRSGIEQSVPIGNVMNSTQDAEVVSPDQRFIIKADDFVFHTGITLCDFTGGDDITRDYKKPIRTLLMDASGRLFVRHQLDDAEAINNHKAVFEADEQGAGAGGRAIYNEGGGRGRGDF